MFVDTHYSNIFGVAHLQMLPVRVQRQSCAFVSSLVAKTVLLLLLLLLLFAFVADSSVPVSIRVCAKFTKKSDPKLRKSPDRYLVSRVNLQAQSRRPVIIMKGV